MNHFASSLTLLLLLSVGVGCSIGDVRKSSSTGRPNIILINVDDLGYADLGCYGSPDIPTPNIDALAASGVRFTNAYSSAALCSPSRAGLLTGQYQQRFGYEFNLQTNRDDYDESRGLPATTTTVAEALGSAGFVTSVIGKWDLGMGDHHHPLRHGFDEFFGFLYGASNYLPRESPEFRKSIEGAEQVDRAIYSGARLKNAWVTPSGAFIEYDRDAAQRNPIYRNHQEVEENEYLTDAFTREAVDFIRRHDDEPFFLYLSYNAPHSPSQAPAKYLAPFLGKAMVYKKYSKSHIYPLEKRRTWAAMVHAVDAGVGAIVAQLRQSGLERQTLVFFVDDNGGSLGASANNFPLRSGKGSVYEGGLRVPFIVSWPGTLPPGVEYDHPVISLDAAATALALVDAPLPEEHTVDGVNLVPHLVGEKKEPPHKQLFWRRGGHMALRRGDWKLLRTQDGPLELYNLKSDIGEQHDLAAEKPALTAALYEAFQEWSAQMRQPLWPNPWGARGLNISGADSFEPLFYGKTLEAFVQRGGKAKYEVVDGVIIGTTVPNTPNSFLCTKKNYSNFILESKSGAQP